MLKLLSVIALAFLLVGCSDSGQETPSAGEVAAVDSVEFKVEEMDCGSCIRKVKKALYEFPGIKNVKTDLDTKMVKIEISDKKLFNLEAAQAKVHEATCEEEAVEVKE